MILIVVISRALLHVSAILQRGLHDEYGVPVTRIISHLCEFLGRVHPLKTMAPNANWASTRISQNKSRVGIAPDAEHLCWNLASSQPHAYTQID